DLFNITAGDVGRPITDFTHRLQYDGLANDGMTVLDKLTPVEKEIRSQNGNWYLMRLRPYRTVDNKIDGVVATFLDITGRRQMEEARRSSEDHLRRQSQLVELSRTPIFAFELDGGIVEWNRGSEQLYGYSRDEALGKQASSLLKTSIRGSSLAKRLIEE